MKRATALLLAIGVLTLSATMIFSVFYMEPGEPICVDPCDPPVTCLWSLDSICESEVDGTEEILGVTQDGIVIVRYKGKVYIFVTSNNYQ